MPDMIEQTEQQRLSTLVGGIIEDMERLFRQEIALAKREIQDEWDKTKRASVCLIGGVATLGLSAVLLSFMLVKLLTEVFLFREWAGFLIVGGVIAVAGGILLYAGIATLTAVKLVPPRTAQTLEQNIEAISGAVAGDGPNSPVEQRMRGGTP
jgi:cytochrome c biogenesis protein CcdA